MNLVLVHFRTRMIELARSPGYVVPTVLLPTVFFMFFGASSGRYRDAANFAMTAYAVFAVLGVCFFQFGVRLAAERANPWETYVRSLPLSPGVRYTSVVLTAIAFAAVAVGLVVAAALIFTRASMPAPYWIRWSMALLLGSIPFVLFGIALGYFIPPQAVVPAANLIYLPLSFFGGLFIAPSSLPKIAATISQFVPSRHFAELAWASILGHSWPLKSVVWLAAYTLLFSVLATYAYRRAGSKRFA